MTSSCEHFRTPLRAMLWAIPQLVSSLFAVLTPPSDHEHLFPRYHRRPLRLRPIQHNHPHSARDEPMPSVLTFACSHIPHIPSVTESVTEKPDCVDCRRWAGSLYSAHIKADPASSLVLTGPKPKEYTVKGVDGNDMTRAWCDTCGSYVPLAHSCVLCYTIDRQRAVYKARRYRGHSMGQGR